MALKNRLELILVLIFLTIFFLPSIGGLALNYLWYDSLGYAEVFFVKYKNIYIHSCLQILRWEM